VFAVSKIFLKKCERKSKKSMKERAKKERRKKE
jgi:hypothetical protein